MKTSITEQANVHARQSLTRWILLKRKATRSELVTDTGLCAASVTNHTRWMIEQGLIKSTPTRVPDVKRSVDLLQLNPDNGVLMLIDLQAHQVSIALLDIEGQPLYLLDRPIEQPTQREIFKVLGQSVLEMRQWARDADRNIDHAGMCVHGTMVSNSLIFSIDGVADWRPCEPKLILRPLNDIPKMDIWTHIMCKLLGFASQQKTDDQIGYVEYRDNNFHIATLRKGKVCLGTHGTTSSFLHESVDELGPTCYCGRKGCLAHLLESGCQVDPRLLANTFIQIVNRIRVSTLAMEWDGAREWLQIKLEESGYNTHWIDDGKAMVLDGLHILTAQEALTQKLAYLSKSSKTAQVKGAK